MIPQTTSLQLVLRNISKRFGSTQALSGLDLEITPGECLALVGENGAGKSTLLKIISGQILPDSGEMQLNGLPYQPGNPRAALQRGVAIVHQELCLASHLSVEANIMLGREPGKFGWIQRRQSRELARHSLAELDQAHLNLESPVSELGPATRQLVEIARALASNAKILLLDEPTSSLSESDTEKLFQTIDRLKARGMAIVFISHALEEVDRVADRIAVLRDGQLVRSANRAEWDRDSIIAAMVGRSIEDLYPPKPAKIENHHAATGIQLTNIRGVHLPVSVSFCAKKSEILGIAGLIGSGRTETVRLMMGLDRQKSGQLKIADSTLKPNTTTRQRMNLGLGMLSEDRANEGLALDRSIESNMHYPIYNRFARWGFLSQKKVRANARQWIETLGIRCQSPDQPVRRLSGGNQQKVALARLLGQQADVLILDEPTRGVDVGAKVEIYRLIRQQAEQGKTVIVISSYLPELLGLCDQIAVMRNGEISEVRPVSAWTQESIMHWATSGHGPSEIEMQS